MSVTPAPTVDTRPLFEAVTLSMPLQRGETSISALTIRRPKAGELRGLALPDIMTGEVVAMLTLIPRISEPPLTADEANALDPADLAEIAGTIRGFFMTKGEKAVMEAMAAQYQPKT